MHLLRRTGFIILFLLSFITGASAQVTLHGTVTDAQTGEALPSANILVKGTYQGTITNANGEYKLTVRKLPATVLVRYIGYHSEERAVTVSTDARQDFALQPSTVELQEIVVTDEDPGERIMREVIRRKQQWRAQLNSYRAEAYTRQTLSNDTSIVSISESASQTFWGKGRGHREVIKWRRQTSNLSESQNFAGVRYLPNFYDDNIEIAGFDLVGITNPDALKYYHFKLVGQQSIDDRAVYEIKVTPARKLQPLFEGTAYVLDGDFALLQVRLRPNRVVDFPPPVQDFNTYYEQQFSNYGGDFWLPVDVRINGDIKISMVGLDFPKIGFRQVSRISDYRVNVQLPDSLYKMEDDFVVDSTAVKSDSLLVRRLDTVPLSRAEEAAYQDLDSTATLEKAFKPSGFLARFIDMDDGDGSSRDTSRTRLGRAWDRVSRGVSPELWYNRVDGAYWGLKVKRKLFKGFDLKAGAGYAVSNERWSYGLGGEWQPPFVKNLTVGGGYRAGSHTNYKSDLYGRTMASLQPLLGYADYFDYHWSEGYELFARKRWFDPRFSLQLKFHSLDQSSMSRSTSYNLLGRDYTQRINPPVEEGLLRSLSVKATLGDDDQTYGVTGRNMLSVAVEHGGTGLGGDFSFTRYTLLAEKTLTTFYPRRLLPNTLSLKAAAGTFSGDLPMQRLGAVDASLGFFSPFGVMKTLRYRPYVGEQYALLYGEHNFRSIPFEAVGLHGLADKGWSLLAFGGAARTWNGDARLQSLRSLGVRTTGRWHTEAGVSLSGLFGIFRIDFAKRLDAPGTTVGISVARVF